MRIKIICPIFYLNITDASKTLFNEFFELKRMTDNSLEQYLGADFINEIGHIEFEMMKGRYHATGYIDVPDDSSLENIIYKISETFAQINKLVKTLWYVRDNSVQMGTIYAEYTRQGHSNAEYTYQAHKSYNSLTDTTFNATNFTVEEILDALNNAVKYTKKHEEENERRKELHQKQNANVKPKKVPPIPVPKPNKSILSTTDNVSTITRTTSVTEYNYRTRLDRAITFIDNARNTEFLPFKIAMYMCCLESLVSTSDKEISKTVGRRISMLLADSSLSKIIVDGYEVRSKLLHGDIFQNKHTNTITLQQLSKKVDDICRKAIILIIDKHSETFLSRENKKIETFFGDEIIR